MDVDRTETNTGNNGGSGSEDQDEIKEMRKLSHKDTQRILLWRFVVTAVLAATAFTVTFTTYRILVNEQHESFKTGVSRKSKCMNISDCVQTLPTVCLTLPFLYTVLYNPCFQLRKRTYDNNVIAW
jgi:hypothetical protein